MIITKQFTMALDRRDPEPLVDAVQGDSCSREVAIMLTSGGQPWTIPEGTKATMRYRRPDGTGGDYEKMPDGSGAFRMQGNVITAAIAPELLTVPGQAEAQIELAAGDRILATFTFIIMVQANPQANAALSSSPAQAGMAAYYFTVTEGEGGNYIADRTYQEVLRRHQAGYAVYCKITVSREDSILGISGGGDAALCFAGAVSNGHVFVRYDAGGQITVTKEDLSPEVVLGNTSTVLPVGVFNMLRSGKTVILTHVDATYGTMAFTGFAYVEAFKAVFGSGITRHGDALQQMCLCGDIAEEAWTLTIPAAGGADITVDEQLDENSTNPVQNKAIFREISRIDDALDETIVPRILPKVTAEDNGKILQVANGKWAAAEMTDVSEVGM